MRNQITTENLSQRRVRSTNLKLSQTLFQFVESRLLHQNLISTEPLLRMLPLEQVAMATLGCNEYSE